MSRSFSDHHMDDRGRPSSHHRRVSQEETEDVLKSDDPPLDTCCVVRTRMDRGEQEVDARLQAMVEACLHAAHQQYHTMWPSNGHAGRVAHPVFSPSLRAVHAEPPCSEVLVYQPQLATYAASAFREYRSLLVTFRRVQSQLSPSLAVSARVPDCCMLPVREGRGRAMNGHQGSGHERKRGGSAGDAMEPGGVREGVVDLSQPHEDSGYEGCVLVPQLYYSVPAPLRGVRASLDGLSMQPQVAMRLAERAERTRQYKSIPHPSDDITRK